MGPDSFRPFSDSPNYLTTNLPTRTLGLPTLAGAVRNSSDLSIYALDHDTSDDLENLRLDIRLIEEMDAYFGKLESLPSTPNCHGLAHQT